MNSTLFKKAAVVLPYIFYTLLLIFLVNYLVKLDYTTLRNIRIDWVSLSIAAILGMAVRYWGAFIWLVLLRGLGAKNTRDWTSLLHVYAKSWLARYIPGTAAWIVSKVYFASRQGVSKHKLAISSLLEAGLQVTVVMATAVIILAADSRFSLIPNSQRWLLFVASATCIILLLPPVFNRLISLAYRVVKRTKLEKSHYVDTKSIARGSALYVTWSFLGGLCLFFVARSLHSDIGVSDILFIVGASSLSGALSMLAFFAPSGIGVREGVLLVLLGHIMPAEIALAVTIFARLWDVVLDLLFYISTRLHPSIEHAAKKT